jgi:hypothetical protein
VSANGRPIRFLAIVLGGWTAVRVAMLWPSIEMPSDVVDAVLPRAAARASPGKAVVALEPTASAMIVSRRTAQRVTVTVPSMAMRTPSVPVLHHARIRRRAALPRPDPRYPNNAEPVPFAHAAAPAASLPLAPPASRAARWSGSGWLVVRAGGSTGAAFAGSQLGGSQAGLRSAYTIDAAHRLAIAGRVSAPFSGDGREAAIGLEWQPTPFPVRIIAEERVFLDSGRGGPTLGLIGGIGPVAVAPGMTAQAYGQAGAIARDGIETFADGAVRVAHELVDIGPARVDIGVGAWGAAQRGAARLDTGPSLSTDVPIGGRAHARLSLDWRARVAGDARLGSGLVLTLGTDF